MSGGPEAETPKGAASSRPHHRPVAAVALELGAELEEGLSEDEVRRRRGVHGDNALPERPPPSLLSRILAQTSELVILVLIAAAVISAAMSEWLDAGVILAIVALNVILGLIQEARAERAIAALAALAAPKARVIRGGQPRPIPTRELVPGDLVELEAGDQIPADIRLTRAFNFQAQEAALTGESLPVDKEPEAVLAAEAPVGDRATMAFMGTMASRGKARGLVTAIGIATELGRIAELVAEAKVEPTPLQRRLAELGRFLVALCLGLVALIFVLQMARGRPLAEVFFLSVSLAVASIPEGLPAVVTLTLALGLQRLAKRNAIIRKLPSVETLGSVTTICSDKTGTLTRNQMSLEVIITAGGVYRLTGNGYDPEGAIRARPFDALAEDGPEALIAALDEPADAPKLAADAAPELSRALRAGLACNDSALNRGEDGQWRIVGDPTEGALIVAARRGGLTEDTPPPLSERPFDSTRKRMSVVVDDPDGVRRLYAKGAPEALLPLCERVRVGAETAPLGEEGRARLLALCQELSSRAYRSLALAYRDDAELEAEEAGLVFAGLVGMTDPPREEAKRAVAACRQAGIRPVMITGDHPQTAAAIARQLGISDGEEAVTGAEIEAWSPEEMAERVGDAAVFARVSAEHKLRLVDALKRRGEVVAMTGDGVNDAPALKRADIGVAMGLSGTDVSREASAMVLADDNFASITSAVEEGRGIFDNIQNFVLYLLSCNAGEMLFVLIATILGWPTPLLAIQVLWINLVTDGLPALALGLESPEPGIMERPPRPPAAPLIGWRRGAQMITYGGIMAGATLAAFAWGWRESETTARTLAFCTLSFTQLFFALSCRSPRLNAFALGLLSNRALIGALLISAALQVFAVQTPGIAAAIFKAEPLSWQHWTIVLGLALIPVSLIELAKIIFGAKSSPAKAE